MGSVRGGQGTVGEGLKMGIHLQWTRIPFFQLWEPDINNCTYCLFHPGLRGEGDSGRELRRAVKEEEGAAGSGRRVRRAVKLEDTKRLITVSSCKAPYQNDAVIQRLSEQCI